MEIKEVRAVRRYKAGYEVRTELIDGSEFGGDNMEMKSAYTPNGHYIGSSVWAYRLCKVCGIKPQPRPEETYPDEFSEYNGGAGPTCSIGFCERKQKWYGWSHRAICGFGVGSIVDSEDHVCATSDWTDEFLEEHPGLDLHLPVGFEAKTLEDAKQMAVSFAAAVS